MYSRVLGALLDCGRRLSHPSLLARLLPLRRAISSPFAALPMPALGRVTAATLPVAALRARFPRARTIAARACPLQRFPSALVRSATLRAHHASNPSTHARRAPNFRRSDVASSRAQSARGTMRNARGIVWGAVYLRCRPLRGIFF